MYTAKPLLFPHVKKLSELFSVIETDWVFTAPVPWSNDGGCSGTLGPYCAVQGPDYRSLWVKPTDEVVRALAASLVVSDRLYFECIVRDDNTCLVVAKYNKIIGSRWLALVPSAELDQYAKQED